MTPKLTAKIAAAASALLLAGTVAASATDAPPEAADDGLARASEEAGFEVPVRAGASAEALETDDAAIEEETGDDELEAAESLTEDDGDDLTAEQGKPEDNHGAAVSAMAQTDHESGRAHGEAVSEVARSNGQGQQSAPAGGETDDAEEIELDDTDDADDAAEDDDADEDDEETEVDDSEDDDS